jgi:NTP pyrophosphatase (non-canonical NTP hydrolase)
MERIIKVFENLDSFEKREGKLSLLSVEGRKIEQIRFEKRVMNYVIPTLIKGTRITSSNNHVRNIPKPGLVLVGIAGYARSGKSEAGKRLISEAGFKQYDFFASVKQLIMDIYGFSYDELHGNKTQESRRIMNLMFDLLDKINPDIYIHHSLDYILNYDLSIAEADVFTNRWCIADLRLEREMLAVKQLGGVLWKVNRPIEEREATEKGITKSTHKSERELDVVPSELFDAVISNDGTLEELHEEIDDLIRQNGYDEKVTRFSIHIRKEFRDFEDYYKYLLDVKLEALLLANEYSRRLEAQIEDIALQYAGRNRMLERSEKDMKAKSEEAQRILRAIFDNEYLQLDFVPFLLAHQVQDTWRNRQTPLYLVLINWLLGRPIYDRGVVDSKPNALKGNLTVEQHPWFGTTPAAKEIMAVDKELLLARPHSRKIRILIAASAEKLYEDSSSVFYLRKLLDETVGDQYEIDIVADDINFPRFVHRFDRSGRYRGKVQRLKFDKNQEYMDAERNVTLRELNVLNNRDNLFSNEFMPRENYDFVICSRLAINYPDDRAKIKLLRKNLSRYLSERGVLLFDNEDAVQAEIIQVQSGVPVKLSRVVPYQDIDSEDKIVNRIISRMTAVATVEDREIVFSAYQLAERYALVDRPVSEKAILAQLIAATGADVFVVAAALLMGITHEAIRSSLEEEVAQRIIDILTQLRYEPILVKGKSRDVFNELYRQPIYPASIPQDANIRRISIYDGGLYKVELGAMDEVDIHYVIVTKQTGSVEHKPECLG